MCAKSNEWLKILNTIPGHILEGQDWEAQGVIYSIRRDADDKWTWFEGKPDPRSSGGVAIRKVCSGPALNIWRQVKQLLKTGLPEDDRRVLGLPTRDDAFSSFPKDNIPGHVLAGHDWLRSDVIYSVRRESENTWTWFESQVDVDGTGRVTVREVCSGPALSIWREVSPWWISDEERTALGFPTEEDAFRESVKDVIPGYVLGEQDLQEKGVIYSVRRESEDRWTWFETKYDPDTLEAVVQLEKQVTALFIWKYLDYGLAVEELTILGLPTEADAYESFKEEVLRLLPGIYVGSEMQYQVDEHRSVVRDSDGTWRTYRAWPEIIYGEDAVPDDANYPERFVAGPDKPLAYYVSYDDEVSSPEDVLRVLYKAYFDIDKVLQIVEAADPNAADELRLARPNVNSDPRMRSSRW